VRLRNKLGSATLLVAFLFIFFLVVLPLAALFGLLLARLALVMLSRLSTMLTLSWLARFDHLAGRIVHPADPSFPYCHP
jgi:hypothetical protein